MRASYETYFFSFLQIHILCLSHVVLCFFGFHLDYFLSGLLLSSPSSPGASLCLLQLFTCPHTWGAFTIRVSGDAFTASQTTWVSSVSASPSGSSLHSPFLQLSCLFPVRPFRQISWWCPSDSMQPFCFFFLILVHPQVMLFHRYLQGFLCLCAFHFLYFFNDLILQFFTRSVLHSEVAFDPCIFSSSSRCSPCRLTHHHLYVLNLSRRLQTHISSM